MAMQNVDYIALLADMPGFFVKTRQGGPGVEISQEEDIPQGFGDRIPVVAAGLDVEHGGPFTKERKGGHPASLLSRLTSRILHKQVSRGQTQMAQMVGSESPPTQRTLEASARDAFDVGQEPQAEDMLHHDTSETKAFDQMTTKKKLQIFPLQLWPSNHPSFKLPPDSQSPRSPLMCATPHEQALWRPPETKSLPEEGHILALTIHQAQPLVPELRLTSPVVRMHCVDRTTGHYLKKTDAARPAVLHNEACDYIMPLQTKPFDLKQGGRGGILSATWEECLLLDEEAVRFFAPDALLLLEILQLPASLSKQKRGRLTGGVPAWKLLDGHYRVAWAYLAPQSPLGQPHLGRVSLQLYHYAPPPRFRSREAPEVFATWQSLCDPRSSARARRKRARRLLYPGAIAVTTAAVPRPRADTVVAAPQVGVRGLLASQVEAGRLGAEDLLQEWQDKNQGGEQTRNGETGGALLTEDDVSAPQHARAHHEPCIVPTVLQHRLAAGSRGCVRIRFSPSGRFLAVVASEALLYPLLVFSAHSGALLATFQGHQSLAYDLSWTTDDCSILTASSDFTAKLWDFSPGLRTGRLGASLKQPGAATGGPATVFQHPCYVYGAAFHPTALAPRLVATAAFDGHVRVWDRDGGEMLRQIPLHKTHINALVFDHVGKRLFTGDGSGAITECSCDFSPEGGGLKPLRTSTELGGEPITCLRLAPSGRRLFALARRNRLVGIDSRLFTVDRRYRGLRCQDHPVAFDVSPDGRFLVAGSEDGRAYMWQVDSGAVFSPFPPLPRSEAVYECAWNPVEHTVAIAAVGVGSPGMIFCPDPSLVQQFDPQGTLSASFDPILTGTTFVMSPEHPLPAELRRMQRSGPLLPMDKFTPEKIKEMLSTLRTADTRRLTAAGTPRDARAGPPEQSEVKWQAGLELREQLERAESSGQERLEVARAQNAGRGSIEQPESAGEGSSDGGRRKSERQKNSEGASEVNERSGAHEQTGRKAGLQKRCSWTRSSGLRAEQNLPEKKEEESERVKVVGASAQEVRMDVGFAESPKILEAKTSERDSGEAREEGLRKARSRSSDRASVADEGERNGTDNGPGRSRESGDVDRKNRLEERRKARNKWMEFRPEGEGAEQNRTERVAVTSAQSRDEREVGPSGSTYVGSRDEEQTARKERRLSESRKKGRGEWNELRAEDGTARNPSRVATLRRISSRLKEKLKLDLNQINADKESPEDGDQCLERDGKAPKRGKRRSGKEQEGKTERAESNGNGGRNGAAQTAERSLTGRLAKVLDPRERIKARLERQRSRGPLA